MTDLLDELKAVHRATGTKGDARTIVLTRRYDAPAEDVWDAVTDPERLRRWFMPVTGDLRVGGRYQTEGNAGGTIVACEPPRRLAVTWEMGEVKEGDLSQVEVRLSEVDGATEFVLEHVATVEPEFWDTYGPGAVGVGWDLSLLGLWGYLRGAPFDHAEFETSPEAREYLTASSEDWRVASVAGGIPEEDAKRMADNTTAFYVPPVNPETPAEPQP